MYPVNMSAPGFLQTGSGVRFATPALIAPQQYGVQGFVGLTDMSAAGLPQTGYGVPSATPVPIAPQQYGFQGGLEQMSPNDLSVLGSLGPADMSASALHNTSSASGRQTRRSSTSSKRRTSAARVPRAERDRITCDQPGCDVTFGRGAEFMRHMITVHHSEHTAYYRCMHMDCDYKYPRMDKVRSHMEKMHGLRVRVDRVNSVDEGRSA
jgi:hypothetical protein